MRLLRYKIAWWRWALVMPYKMGDPTLGSGELRRQNIRLMHERHERREPKRSDYGL